MDLSIYYARTVIAGAVTGTLAVLWAVDLATVRRARDPARAWVRAMKVTMPLEIMYVNPSLLVVSMGGNGKREDRRDCWGWANTTPSPLGVCS
jgi:hypothetical protein